MVLDLQVEVITKNFFIGECPLLCLFKITIAYIPGNNALHTSAQAHDTLMVGTQHIQAHARLVIHHLVTSSLGHALNKVYIACLIFCQQNKVKTLLFGAARNALILNEVRLTSKNRLNKQLRLISFDRLKIMGLIPNGNICLPLCMSTVMRQGI